MLPKPNILVILTDQLRRDALGCYGDVNVSTPHIDKLAETGVQFNAACSTYPVCVPFRFSMFTGHYAHSRQVPGIDWRMSPCERTMADEFNDEGYESIYIGKWHLNGGHGPGVLKTPVPREYQGRFKKWFGFELRNSFFDTCYFEDDDPTPIEIEGYQTDGLFGKAMDYLDERNEKDPFLCILSVEAPHPPREAPEEYEARWRDKEITLPPNFLVKGDLDENVQGWARNMEESDRERLIHDRKMYYAMIENLDWNVGRLVKNLDEAGRLEDTIIILISDHGDSLGSHGYDQKQYPYEESCGIPFILNGAGIPKGRKIADPISTEDIFPTVLGLADIKPQQKMYGHDTTRLIKGGESAIERPGVMLEHVSELRECASFYSKNYRGFRSSRYKYTVWGMSEGLQPWQFFDLENDPYELNNLINDESKEEDILQHHKWLLDRMKETGDSEWIAAAWGEKAVNPWVYTGSGD